MPEVLDFVPAKEGLATLGGFLEENAGYKNLSPFALPAKWSARYTATGFYGAFNYSIRASQPLAFSLTEKQLSNLGDSIYVVPHAETTKGLHPYYWLTLHATPEAELPELTSCLLRPGQKNNQTAFSWHGFAEQLLADYVLGVNGLKFEDLMPFDLAVPDKGIMSRYQIAGKLNPDIIVRITRSIDDGDTLRFAPRRDDQKLYDWFDILKIKGNLPEERWPLVTSYRILLSEHRMYSSGWYGPERQLLIDRMQGVCEIGFDNLRPIRAVAGARGKVYLFVATTPLGKLKGILDADEELLPEGTETISLPRTDDQRRYEWLELYRYDPSTNSSTGTVLTTSRITPESLNQKNWFGAEKQLLQDYTQGLIKFENLRPIPLTVGNGRQIHLFSKQGEGLYITFSKIFCLQPGDNLTLVPEQETEEGTDFLLVQGSTRFARYRLDINTRSFTRTEDFVAEQTTIKGPETEDLEEYERRLLAGEKLSYEEFLEQKLEGA